MKKKVFGIFGEKKKTKRQRITYWGTSIHRGSDFKRIS